MRRIRERVGESRDMVRTVETHLLTGGPIVGERHRRVVQRRDEGVTAAVLGTNVLGSVGIVVEGPPQLAHEHLDVVGLHVRVGPHRRQDVVVRDDRAGALDQAPQKV